MASPLHRPTGPRRGPGPAGPTRGAGARARGAGWRGRLPGDPGWRLVEEGFDLAREHEVESLLAISNGYLGVRASLAERSEFSAPALFVAGVFGRRAEPGAVPELVVAPDAMRLRLEVDGEEVAVSAEGALEHRRVLDMRRAILWREWRHRTQAGRVARGRGRRRAALAGRPGALRGVALGPGSRAGGPGEGGGADAGAAARLARGPARAAPGGGADAGELRRPHRAGELRGCGGAGAAAGAASARADAGAGRLRRFGHAGAGVASGGDGRGHRARH